MATRIDSGRGFQPRASARGISRCSLKSEAVLGNDPIIFCAGSSIFLRCWSYSSSASIKVPELIAKCPKIAESFARTNQKYLKSVTTFGRLSFRSNSYLRIFGSNVVAPRWWFLCSVFGSKNGRKFTNFSKILCRCDRRQ